MRDLVTYWGRRGTRRKPYDRHIAAPITIPDHGPWHRCLCGPPLWSGSSLTGSGFWPDTDPDLGPDLDPILGLSVSWNPVLSQGVGVRHDFVSCPGSYFGDETCVNLDSVTGVDVGRDSESHPVRQSGFSVYLGPNPDSGLVINPDVTEDVIVVEGPTVSGNPDVFGDVTVPEGFTVFEGLFASEGPVATEDPVTTDGFAVVGDSTGSQDPIVVDGSIDFEGPTVADGSVDSEDTAVADDPDVVDDPDVSEDLEDQGDLVATKDLVVDGSFVGDPECDPDMAFGVVADLAMGFHLRSHIGPGPYPRSRSRSFRFNFICLTPTRRQDLYPDVVDDVGDDYRLSERTVSRD